MEGFLGEIRVFAGNFAPKGWHFCDGTQFNVKGNEGLFSILGAQYGGDGRTTFQIPKLEPLLPNKRCSFIICVVGKFPARP